MRFRALLTLTTLFIICFAVTVFAQPLHPMAAVAGTDRVPENQSLSGQIVSVGDAVFTVSVSKDKQAAQTVEFLMDDKTKVEGKLTIGAHALVEYRSDSGKNIAVHVVITPASGMGPY